MGAGMLYIIDGTGSWSNDSYRREMATGFCMEMSKQFGGWYERGPSIDGWSTFSKAEACFSWILQNPRLKTEPLFLAGHSRGGAAIIRVAQLLKTKRIPVKAMFLFDAVDRTLNGRSVEEIPCNVGKCYHAMRDRSLSTYYEEGLARAEAAKGECLRKHNFLPSKCQHEIENHEWLKKQDELLKYAMRTHFVRPQGKLFPSIDFGNCGCKTEPIHHPEEVECVLEKETFLGTHGAIGGSPILDEGQADKDTRFLIRSDAAAVASVRAWMWGNFRREGLASHYT